MFKFLFSLAIVGVVVSSSAPKTKPNLEIIGGEGIDIKDAPYQVSLNFKSDYENPVRHICGGSIVSHNVVITAAHCVTGTGEDFANYKIRVGSSSCLEGGELYSISDIVIHEDYDHIYDYDNDVAVIWLSNPMEFHDGISSIDMFDKNEELKEGDKTFVSGWGHTEEYDIVHIPKTLQRTEVPIVSEESCRTKYATLGSTITPRMLCAGFTTGGKGPCNGDSGGPLVYNGKLAGVVSFSYGCARPEWPNVYAKVSALRQWIDDTISKLRLTCSLTT